MDDMTLNALATAAAEAAMRAAADYLRLNKVRVTDFPAATDVIREEIKKSLDEALGDAKAALDVNMGLAAVATFRASMAQAGIRAGKRIEKQMKAAA